MQQPHEVWGVHVVQGAAIAVKLRRSGEAAFEIESAYVEPNDGKTLPVHVASMLLARRGPRGEPAVVALPDAAGFLATVRVHVGEGGRSEDEIAHELYKTTPFEPGHAELRHVRVSRDGGDEVRLVAALPRSAISAAVHEFERKSPLPAIAFGGAAIIRGARALGLCPDPCVLVEVEPHVTVAYLVDHGHVRRRPIPYGEREIVKDAAHCEKLVHELHRFADARPAAAHGEHAPVRATPFVLVGPGTASSAVRQRLAEKLGDRLAGGTIGDARVRPASDGRLHHAPTAALAGAVGAALEAFLPPEERLLFRDLPADLHAHQERSPAPLYAAAAVITAVAFVGYEVWRSTRADETPAQEASGGASDTAGGSATASDATAPPAAGRTDASGPSAGTAAAGRPTVEPAGPGRVRVSWPAGREGRVLRRFDVAWKDVEKLGAGAGSLVDEIAGATQLYGWRIDEGEAAFARVEIPVEVEFLGAAAKDGARFVLRRTWRGAPCSVTVDVAPGEAIRVIKRVGEPPVDVVFDSECWLVAVRESTAVDRSPARVPQFNADGTVERGPDRAALLVERIIERGRRVVEAEGTTGSGFKRTWTRTASQG